MFGFDVRSAWLLTALVLLLTLLTLLPLRLPFSLLRLLPL
jgi:hypothetical protein